MKQRLRQAVWVVLAGVIGFSGAWLAVGATPAAAGRVDCTNPGTCGFGALVAGPLSTSLSTSEWSATGVTSNAYLLGTTYSYEYIFPLDASSNVSLREITTSSLGQDLFDPSLKWGVVTNETTDLGKPVDFGFGSSSFVVTGPTAGADILDPGNTLAFYAQSPFEPIIGTISGQDGGTGATGSSLDPTPEPSSLMLLSSGALGLVGLGLGNFRRKRYSEANLAVD